MLKKLNNICRYSIAYTVLFFLFLENPRAQLSFISENLNAYISYARDFGLFCAMLYILITGIKLKKKSALLFSAVLLLISSVAIVVNSAADLKPFIHGNYTYFRSLLYFMIFDSLLKNHKDKRFFGKSLVFFTFCTFFLTSAVYFFFNHFIVRDQGARVSIGNASIHSAMFFFVSLYSLHGDWTNSRRFKMISFLLFTAAGALTSTSTWFMCFSVLLLYSTIYRCLKFIKNDRFSNQKTFSFILISIFTSSTLAPIVFFEYLSDSIRMNLANKAGQVFSIFLGENLDKVGTLYLRDDQFNAVTQHFGFKEIFIGLGPDGYLKYTHLLENQFYVFFANYGVLGLLSFVFFIASNFISKLPGSNNASNRSLSIAWICFGLYSYTLETFICVQLIGIFALVTVLLDFSIEDSEYVPDYNMRN